MFYCRELRRNELILVLRLSYVFGWIRKLLSKVSFLALKTIAMRGHTATTSGVLSGMIVLSVSALEAFWLNSCL
jgi:hypothetical protein